MKTEALALVLVVLLVVAVIGVVVILSPGGAKGSTSTTSSTGPSTTTSTSPTSTPTSTETSTETTVFSLNAPDSSLLVDESPQGPFDSLDPHYGFFTVDGYFAQVFQGLVAYNGSDSLHVVPALAESWEVSSNYENYTFHMRPNTWFSNMDPINAYTAWFSFVRVNYMNAPTTVGFSNYDLLLYNGTTPGQNFVPWGLYSALESVDHGLRTERQLTTALNQMLSHFDPSNATQQAIMSYPHQALVARNGSIFQMNLIQPYSLFLLALPPQWGALVDPAWIDANGGVGNNTVIENFNTGDGNKMLMPGSGPYEYASATPFTTVVLSGNPHYWAIGVAGLAAVLSPPKIPVVRMDFGRSDQTLIGDFGDNVAQISFESTDLFDEMYGSYQYSSHFSFRQLLHNLGSPMCDLAVGMNTKVFPTNITDFRLAVVHAVNYSEMLSKMYTFNGTALGTLFLPPVPPGWGPTDNPDNLQLYQYNVTLAERYLNASGYEGHFFTSTSAGEKLGDLTGTQLPALPYYYIVPATNQTLAIIDLLKSDLSAIGINVTAVGDTTACYDNGNCGPSGPQYFVGVGWCGDWADPIFQQFYELATPGTLANEPAGTFTNSTLTKLLTTIPFETNATQQVRDSAKAWAIYSQLAGIIQTPQPDTYFFVQPYVQGLTYSPFQFAIYYNLLYYQPAL